MGERQHIEKQFQIIEAIKNNNEFVLKKLYQDNFRKVEMHILKNNGTMPHAKDIYQEAFIAVWKNVKDDKFVPQNETAIQGYLYQIAKNKWTDFLRSSNYKKTISIHPLNTVSSEEMDIESEHSTKTSSILLQDAMSAFNDMGDSCKQLLMQFYYHKKSMREIAQTLGIDEASARNKKYRCMQKLRRLVKTPN